MMKLRQKYLLKIVNTRDKIKARLSDNSGQGAIDVAIICEPFFRLKEVVML